MDIDKALDQIPALLAKSAQEAEDARLYWLEAKERYTKEEAFQAITYKAKAQETKPTDVKATDIKFFIANDNALFKQRMDLLVFESTYRKKEVRVKDLQEKLNSAKVIARLKMQELQTTGG